MNQKANEAGKMAATARSVELTYDRHACLEASKDRKTEGFKLHEALGPILAAMHANGGAAALVNGMFLHLKDGSFLCNVTQMFELRRVGFVRRSTDGLYRITHAAREYLGLEMVQGTGLNAEQLSALQRFAARNGRTWKSILQRCWETAVDAHDPDGPLLRGIRNEFGPSWLSRFRLPLEERKMSVSIKRGGTPNITGWVRGDRLTSLADVNVGDILLNICDQFDAQNLVRITRLGNDIVSRDEIAYGMFCDPVNVATTRAPGDHEFSIWEFELRGTRQAYYRATRC